MNAKIEMRKMEYRTLGRTGLRLSVLGFGGIPIRDVSEKQAVAVVNRCIDKGVNFIHTSVTYGDSCQKLSKVLKDRRDEVVLAVKIGGGRARADAEQRLKETFETLRIDHVEVAELPINARDFPEAMAPGGAYEAFVDAQERGEIDHIGITGHDIDFLVDAIQTDAFSNVIVPYNYIANKAEERLLPLARRKGLGIIAMKVMGVGGIPEPPKALRYVLPRTIDTAIVGMSRLEEAEENLRIAENPEPLTDEELGLLREISERIQREGRLKFSGKITQSHAEGVTRVILSNVRS
jgi:predicted aldo/keto reductase-like oxidoreductase